MWKPRRLPQYEYLHYEHGFIPKHSEPSVAADGSLLFMSIAQIKHERYDTGDSSDKANRRNHTRSNMYRLPSRKNFPRGLYTRLHSVPRGMTGNRLFLPYTVEKEMPKANGEELDSNGGFHTLQ